MKTPHKHAALIKAWADGAEIEVLFSEEDRWRPIGQPQWRLDREYRIKPEPKPDVVVERWVHIDGSTSSCRYGGGVNVRYTFDGETGKLKSAEVL